jgi:hypothetical protein
MSLKTIFKKNWQIIPFLLVYALICYAINNSNEKSFIDFYNKDVSGRLSFYEKSNHGFWIGFKLTNGREYYFAPVKNGSEVSGASAFMVSAAKGDSIWKTKKSDTLLLIKKDRVIKYPFKKIY